MAVRRPQLQLGVAGGAQPRQVVVASRIEVDSRQRLGVAAIEPFREPHHRRQRLDGLARRPLQVAVALVRFLRRRLAVVAGDERNHLDLERIEAAQIPVADQIVRMAVMPLVADVHADVMQKRCVFEPLALAVTEPVYGLPLIKQ